MGKWLSGRKRRIANPFTPRRGVQGFESLFLRIPPPGGSTRAISFSLPSPFFSSCPPLGGVSVILPQGGLAPGTVGGIPPKAGHLWGWFKIGLPFIQNSDTDRSFSLGQICSLITYFYLQEGPRDKLLNGGLKY